MSQIKRLIRTFVAGLMVGSLFISGIAQAATSANYTKTDAPAITIGRSTANVLVLDITVPDAWNSGLFTADIVQKAGSAFIAQGDSLTAFTNPGTINGVGFINDATAGFQGTEPVIIDLDGDSVYTGQADILIDADGSATDTAGTVDGVTTAGDALVRLNNAAQPTNAVCTNSLTTPTAVRIDTDTNCNNGTKTEGTYILGTSATQANVKATNAWVFADTITANGVYNDGEDIFRDGLTPAKQTYSPTADTDTYATGGASVVHGATLQQFQADCDGAGIGSRRCRFTGGSFSSASSIVIDEGSKAGVAPNNTVDKQADQLIGLGVQNTGTAVNSTDIASVKAWMENGATAGFQSGEDTMLGTMTVNSGNNKEWYIGGLSAGIPVNGQRFYVTANTAAAATHNATLQFALPQFNDAGADGLATADNDRGSFVSSNNDGPTDAALVNANAQIIDGQAPTLAEVTPVPTPSNNRTPNFTFSTDEAGTISYPGSCSSATTSAVVGNNTITLNSLADGTYNICRVVVTDIYGNASTVLTATTFFVDGTAPTLTEVTPVTTPSTNTTPSYVFNSDEGGSITYGGPCTSAVNTVTLPNTTVNFDPLADGTYSTCTITVTDALGNVSTPLTVNTFVIDTTAPVLAEFLGITSPTNDNTPAYTFSSTEAGTITYGGGCTSGTTSAVVGNNAIVFNSLADGTYSLCTIKVTDALGNASTDLTVTTFTIDTTGVILTEFAPITSPINDNTPDYTFVSDSAGTISYGGSCAATSFTNAIVGNNTITFDTLADGVRNDCTIMVTDAALNPSNTLSVSTFTVDTVAPALTEVTAVPSATNDTTPNYTFSSTEAGTATYGGGCTSATTAIIVGNNTITLDALAEGTYAACTIQVTDAASNSSSVLTLSSFVIDTTAPTLLEVTPVPSLTNDTTPDYTFSSSEAGTISFGPGCSSAVIATIAASAVAGNNTVTFGPLADGVYTTCQIRVTDAANNPSTWLPVTTFQIDATAPVLAEVTPVPSVTYDTTPDYTFSTTEAGTIGYSGDCSSTTTNAVVGNNVITFNDLPLGTHGNCGITVTDAATNTSSTLSVTSFIISTRHRSTPALEVTGVANPSIVQVGGTINLTFTAINRGDVAMNNVSVTSNLCATPSLVSGDVNGDSNLDVSESWVYTCSIVATTTQQGSVTLHALYNGADQTDSVNITISVLQDGGNDLVCTVESAAVEGCNFDNGNGGTPDAPQTDEAQQQALAHLADLQLAPHNLVKARDTKTVYYIGPDARKHVFMSSKVYFTWYCTFTGLKAVTGEDLATIEDGSAVTYRPGVRMVKLTTSNKVYAVEKGHTLRWITTEELAIALYGTDWNSQIDDVASFDGYDMGMDITSVADYAPTIAEQSVTVPADAMNPILGYTPSLPGLGLNCR